MECHYCPEKFNRREHLERHLRRHSGARPFTCPLCSRSFPRRDTLSRHVTTHGAEAEGVLARTRGAAACQACSKDKVKCSGGNPCIRCQDKGRSCVQRKGNRASNVRPSQSRNRQAQLRDSDLDVSVSLIGDAVQGSSPMSQLPAGPSNFDPSANGPIGSQNDFATIEMSADFPWALDYAYFFPESYLGLEQSRTESLTHLDYLPFPSDSTAPISQHRIIDASHPQAHLPSEEPSPLRRRVLTEQHLCQPETPALFSPLATQLTDDDIIMAENFGHVRPYLDDAYQAIFAFYSQQTDRRFKGLPFPDPTVFNSFIQLFYEYFDEQLSFIHPSSLEQNDTPWILVLAVASVGCQYTKAFKRCNYASTLTELLRVSLPIDALQSRSYDTMILAQCTLLLVVNLMFTGFKDNVVNLQAQRAWLATLMRRFVISSTNKDTLLSMEMKSVQPNDQWRSWIRSESGRRLAYCFAVVDCFYFIFLGVDPSFTATDYEQMLPSHDTLWQSRSEGEWKSLSHLLNDQTPPMSLKKIFSLNWMSNGVLQQVSEFNKLILNLMLFVEERRAIEASRSCALFEEEPTFSTKSALSPSYRRLDWKYKLLAPKPFEPSERTGNSDARNIFYHLIGILRHVPRKQLYAYSGWYASEEDMTAAEAYLAGWISENPVFSRECLVHAGALIGQIRSNGPAACYHYFCLLIATSYIWTFTRLQEQGSKELEGRPPLQPPATLLRIDQRHDPSLRDRWVENASGTLVHVTGVGMLSSQGSAERLWKEFLQIMGSRVGWPTLREGMIRCTSELLKNSSPMKGMRYSNSEVSH